MCVSLSICTLLLSFHGHETPSKGDGLGKLNAQDGSGSRSFIFLSNKEAADQHCGCRVNAICCGLLEECRYIVPPSSATILSPPASKPPSTIENHSFSDDSVSSLQRPNSSQRNFGDEFQFVVEHASSLFFRDETSKKIAELFFLWWKNFHHETILVLWCIAKTSQGVRIQCPGPCWQVTWRAINIVKWCVAKRTDMYVASKQKATCRNGTNPYVDF